MAVWITLIIALFGTICVLGACFTAMWFRSCRMVEHENTPKTLKAEGDVIRVVSENM